MHDLLREMEYKIEREDLERQRLWMPESETLLVEDELLADSLETLVINENSDFRFGDGTSRINCPLSGLKSLCILILTTSVINVTWVPKNLRLLSWQSRSGRRSNVLVFPEIPKDDKLVILDIGIQKREIISSERNVLALEILSLIFYSFRNLPDLRLLQRLRKLDMFCASIVEVPGLGDLVALEVSEPISTGIWPGCLPCTSSRIFKF